MRPSHHLSYVEFRRRIYRAFRHGGRALAYIREEENALFVKKLSESATTRSPVNLTKILFTFVASMVFRVAYGQKLHDCKFVDGNSIADLINKFDLIAEAPSFIDLFPGGIGWLLGRISGQTKNLKYVFSELDIFYQSILDDGRRVAEIPGIVRRTRPGMTMGVATVELELLNLLYFLDWVLPEGKTVKDIDLEETGAITLYKKSTLHH